MRRHQRYNYNRIWIFFTLTLSITLFTMSCASGPHKREKSAIELLTEGEAFYKAGKFRTAIESFENLIDWYPFSVHKTKAELNIGDAYFQTGEYHDAIFAYEEFERMHPTHEKAPYVLNQIGTCFLYQMDAIDRDQTPAIQAVRYFDRIRHEYPQSQYAIDAKNNIMTCYQSLVKNEYYVGSTYYKAEHYKAALNRFEIIVTRYPDVGMHQKAIEYITKCRLAMANTGQRTIRR
ncbi:MAG: outer membrane protein assembly factor BamD [Candidatus Magnetomorum sp.]|nr:outer membrane protein assembly factor BamD [Candidatus Magnetomorum sp.]